jgi:hypothetical protein
MDPDPTPDPTPFLKKNFHIFSYNLPAGTLSSVFTAKRVRNGSKKPETYIINVS